MFSKKPLEVSQRIKSCPWIGLLLLNILPDHQKTEGKFKVRIVMTGFQGQIEIFLLGRIVTQQCLEEVCGHVIFRQMVGREMSPIERKKETEVAQSCLTLCDPMDCSLPGSSVHGIFPGNSTGVGCHCLLRGLSVQFSGSVVTLCDPMNCSTPSLPVHHQLEEFTHVH